MIFCSKSSVLKLLVLLTLTQFFVACKQDPPYIATSEMDGVVDDSLHVENNAGLYFNKALSSDGLNVEVKTSGNDELKHLSLDVALNGKVAIKKTLTIDGTIVDAMMADLNKDGKQEVYVFNQSAGSGSYGQLFAFQMDGNRMDSIILDELPTKYLDQYMGHDSFDLQGKYLIRVFPLYHEMDPNCCPTGGMKKLKYKLVKHSGELRLVLDNS